MVLLNYRLNTVEMFETKWPFKNTTWQRRARFTVKVSSNPTGHVWNAQSTIVEFHGMGGTGARWPMSEIWSELEAGLNYQIRLSLLTNRVGSNEQWNFFWRCVRVLKEPGSAWWSQYQAEPSAFRGCCSNRNNPKFQTSNTIPFTEPKRRNLKQ